MTISNKQFIKSSNILAIESRNFQFSRLYNNGVLIWKVPSPTIDFLASSKDIGVYGSDKRAQKWIQTPKMKALLDEGVIFTCMTKISDAFYAGTDGQGIWYSADGETWVRTITKDGKILAMENAYLANSNQHVVLMSIADNEGEQGNSGLWVGTIDDDLEWKQDWKQIVGFKSHVLSIGYGNMVFACGMSNGTIAWSYFTSPDQFQPCEMYDKEGEDEQMINFPVCSWETIKYFKKQKIFIAAGNRTIDEGKICPAQVIYSHDGKKWYPCTLDSEVLDFDDGYYTCVIHDDQKFILASVDGIVGTLTSVDGKTWIKSSDNNKWMSMLYASKVYVGALSEGHGLCYSADGQNWNQTNVANGDFNIIQYKDFERDYITGSSLYFEGARDASIGYARIFDPPDVDPQLAKTVGVKY